MPKIEKNVPVLPKCSGRPIRYGFHKFEIGDSAFFPESEYPANRIYSALSHYSRRNGKVFLCRSTTEKKIKGLRVWRDK